MVLTDEDRADGQSAYTEIATKGHNPVSWVADEGIWDKAKKAARESGKYTEGSDQFWAVVAHIYKQMGGKKKPTTNDEPDPEPEVDMAKAEDIAFLTANCECWKGKQALLNGASDAEVKMWRDFHEKAAKNEKVVNAVTSAGFTVNAETGKVEAPQTNNPTMNFDDPAVRDQVCKSLFGMTSNEATGTLAVAKKVEQRERFDLVHRLTQNIQNEEVRKSKVTELLKRPTSDLELMVSLLPETPVANAQPDETQVFLERYYGGGSREGAQGGPASPTGNRGQKDDQPDVDGGPRPMPTLNVDDLSPNGKKIRERLGR